MSIALWSAGVPDISWLSKILGGDHSSTVVDIDKPSRPLMPLSPVLPQAPPEKSNRLRLLAASPGRNAREGTAQISIGPSGALTYAAGALLANNAVLQEIYTDHVLLERGGSSTRLYIEGAAADPKTKRQMAVDEELLMADAVPSVPRPAESPETYSDLMRAAPKYADGQVVGYEVYPGTDNRSFARLNLRPGDILMAVDGVPLTDVDGLHRALQSIAAGTSVTANVLRGSEQLTMALDGGTLLAAKQTVATREPYLEGF